MAVMASIWLIVKGPDTPDGLPFVDESTTTTSTSDVDIDPTTTTTGDQPGDTSTTTSTSSTDGSDPGVDQTTTTSEPTAPETTFGPAPAGPSTSIGNSPEETIPPGSPSSSTPAPAPPATVPETPTTTVPTTTVPTTNEPEGRQLVFAEEFDSFNPRIWSVENSTYGDGNNELQCYTPEQVTVANGSLVLRAEARTVTCPNGSTRDVTSGMVRSRGVEFAPGQSIEFRVKLTPDDEANQAGLWPAVWSSSWAGGWPTGGEWDGLEVMTANNPRRSVYSIHYANSAGQHAKTSKEVVQAENFSANWHVVRFDYGDDGVLTWYLDGTVVSVVDAADTVQGWPAPFNQAMTELKINLALGGNPGPLDPRALPATFEVDYIRIYSS